MSYASGTTVSAEKSKAEIERILSRYGASAFGYGIDDGRAVVQFRAHDRFVRFVLNLPDVSEFARDRRGYSRSQTAQKNAHDQETRRLWRALALAIKAKLEVVESGIASFEEEFAVQIVLPDGTTVGDRLIPEIVEAYKSGEMPPSLLSLDGPRLITAG